MKKSFEKLLQLITKYSFYIFIFILPWQIKYIISPAGTNYTEISIYLSQIFLTISVLSYLIYRIRKSNYCQKVPFLWLMVSGFSLFVFVSFFIAIDKNLAYYRFIVYLISLGLFYLLRQENRPEAYENTLISKSKTIIVFLSSIFFQAILAIYQFLSQSAFAFKYLGLAEHQPDFLGTSVVETATGRWLRAYGGFDHPNILGGVLALSLILALFLLVRKKLITSKYEIMQSLFLFIFYFTGLLALIFSFSRSAWFAYSVSLIILLIVFLLKRNISAFKRSLIIVFFTLILSVVIYIPFNDLFITRIEANNRLEEKSLNERSEQIVECREVLENNWLFGVGLGNYTNVLKERDQIKKADWNYQPVHNTFLLIFSELGLFSLIFFFGIIIALAKDERKSLYFWPIIISLFVLMFFDHWLLSLPFGLTFLLFILGLI